MNDVSAARQVALPGACPHGRREQVELSFMILQNQLRVNHSFVRHGAESPGFDDLARRVTRGARLRDGDAPCHRAGGGRGRG